MITLCGSSAGTRAASGDKTMAMTIEPTAPSAAARPKISSPAGSTAQAGQSVRGT